jgi:hypothetical protein
LEVNIMVKSCHRLDRLWDHASAGNLMAVVPCNDTGDVLKVGKRLLDAELPGWFGSGSSDSGFTEEFLVAIAERDEEARFRSFVRRVQNDLGLSAVVAKGFDMTLCRTIFRSGQVKALVQQPFGAAAQVEESPTGVMVLDFTVADSTPPLRSDWLGCLAAAYSEIQGHKSFTFEEIYP